MLIPINYGKRFTFAVIAERRAELICSHCGSAFSLTDQVGAVGEGFSVLGLQNTKAEQSAHDRAMKNLETSALQLSPVPCPQCASFHPAMEAILKWILGQKIFFATMGLFAIAGISSIGIWLHKKMSAVEMTLLIGMGIAAVGFLAYRYWKDLRLCPVQVESLPKVDGRPACRIGLRFQSDQDWHWFNK